MKRGDVGAAPSVTDVGAQCDERQSPLVLRGFDSGERLT